MSEINFASARVLGSVSGLKSGVNSGEPCLIDNLATVMSANEMDESRRPIRSIKIDAPI